MSTLLVVPTDREARAVKLGRQAWICGAGAGAYEVVRERLAESRPDVVVLAGLCGGLDPSLRVGSVVLCRHAIAPGLPVVEPDRFLLEDVRKQLNREEFPFVFSRLLTLDAPAGTRDEKRELWNEYGAGGVDMETYHVARAAADAGVRWLAVRSVIDTAKQSLPGSLRGWGAAGDDRGAVRSAAVRPGQWPGMVRLGAGFPRATAALRRAIPRVVRAAKEAGTVETLDLMEAGR